MKIAYLAENFGSFTGFDLTYREIMNHSGHNVGNFAFWNAARLLMEGEFKPFGFNSKPAQVKGADLILIPAANFLNETADLGWLADIIEQTDLPCIIVGLGAQSEREALIPKLKQGTVRFLETISKKTLYLCVRGEFSKQVCEHYGVNNVKVMGCPSLFTNQNRSMAKTIRAKWDGEIQKLAIHAASIKAHVRTVERFLFSRLLVHPGSSYILQRPVELMKMTRGEHSQDDQAYLEKLNQFLCPDLSFSSFSSVVRAYGYIPYSVDSWIFQLKSHSHSLGTRIHGAMMSLAAEIPTICVTHDTRTRELCSVMKVPTIDCSKLSTVNSVSDVFSAVEFEAEGFEENRSVIAASYLELLKSMSVVPSKRLLAFS
jgi:polysaccharide pyruvyl transferase WcaK-like protein